MKVFVFELDSKPKQVKGGSWPSDNIKHKILSEYYTLLMHDEQVLGIANSFGSKLELDLRKHRNYIRKWKL